MMKLRMHRPFTALPHRQRGAVIVLIVIALAAMLLMSALALDGGHMLVNKTRLQNAVDAAALSGAKTLSQVMGSGNASSLTRGAALDTLTRNANAAGNGELASAIGTAGGVGAFAVVELASTVEGPFAYPGPVDARFVRVRVANYSLSGFFWGFAQAFGAGNLGNKAVAAIATAGPSQTAPCNLAPLMVCGDPDQYDPGNGMFWGYRFGDLEVLKSAAGNAPAIGPGNFQLIRLGDNTGADDIRDAMCRGVDQCLTSGEPVETEPGNTVGPVAQGLNTRFGVYNGPVSAAACPPDLVTSFSTPRMTYSEPNVVHQTQLVQSSDGDLYTASAALLDYNDWVESVANCPGGCEANGVFERRLLKIVVGNCDGVSGGQTSVPVLGYGCFFLVQTVSQQGSQAQIFGQFVTDCAGDSVPGPVVDDVGPKIIQLYKTYITPATPSPDS
ncbi:pilus assembly protein TadG-related protein [Pseudomonas sp. sp1636]|uniref:TadE/TadG family type IV pilus assembly protein n=1 Tax=Pseudomonas sp. sp1636 TaxID=3036707 RepID=UPI0025A50E53|nr:pilus assembly protein TadG-related protein [Pseudomonas sp. sp1636]MDM8349823.1 pilus assembly protein TadG-related protein [Pseudomonas sp. sp1636]